jgi:carbon storage regulator
MNGFHQPAFNQRSETVLVLSRRENEELVLMDGRIVVTIVDIRRESVRVGITADESITIHRREVHERIQSGEKVGGGSGVAGVSRKRRRTR